VKREATPWFIGTFRPEHSVSFSSFRQFRAVLSRFGKNVQDRNTALGRLTVIKVVKVVTFCSDDENHHFSHYLGEMGITRRRMALFRTLIPGYSWLFPSRTVFKPK